MKKLLLAISSLFLLAGCGSGENARLRANVVEENVSTQVSLEEKPVIVYGSRLPSVFSRGASTHKTYLLMSPFGYLDFEGAQVKGKVDELFYENTIVWQADAGTDLPDASVVKSTVAGATFRGWAYYDEDNDNVFPDYYTKVPAKSGLALKAIFDGTNAGGGGGGGGGTPAETITYTITQFADWVPNDGATIFVWSWGGGSGDGVWSRVELSYLGENNNYHNVTGTFLAPSDITGFNIARCSAGTTLPNWTATGDSAGRVYNKTANVDVRPGVTSYTAPEFVEYEYIA